MRSPQELDVLLATEDNTVREDAGSLLVRESARVASERLTGSTPNGAPLYETVEVIDGHVVKIASKTPLKSLLSTPQLPENLAAHLPSDPDAPVANTLP